MSGREDEVRVDDRAPAEWLTVEHDQHLPGVSVGRVLDPASHNSIQVLPLEENNYYLPYSLSYIYKTVTKYM